MAAEIIPATADMIPELMADIREADLHEIRATTRIRPEKAIEFTLRTSQTALAGFHDGRLVNLFGVCPKSRILGIGSPWMVATNAVDEVPLTFLRRSRIEEAKFCERFRLLENYVHEDNERAIRWLKWLGYEFDDPEPWGLGENFMRFQKCA